MTAEEKKALLSAQEKMALEVIVTVADTIQAVGYIPSGHLYARLMGYMSLNTYNMIIAVLVKTGSITNKGNLLTWVGQKRPAT